MPFDFKKEYAELYTPKTKPSIVTVPPMTFIMIDGHGDPNTAPEYQNAIEVLYGLAYTIKMSKKADKQPEGYFDFVVPPLEGLWWSEGEPSDMCSVDKSAFFWTAMLRQPDFVNESAFAQAKETLAKKKPHLNLSLARLELFEEALCAQIMHIGSYDDEPATLALLDKFIAESGRSLDISESRRHHEIYLSDPRKTAAEKLKTVLRHPIL
ncbi:MAG: GyrI-like domain-containing protein [Oscillospiraceae bacterium]|jgi:hypothetical protein|nr:GyrI-like domain-containing protein [Oscillospiraceae bacterium]